MRALDKSSTLACAAKLSNPHLYQTRSKPTVTLSIVVLRSVGWSTIRALNNGYFGVFPGSKKDVSGLRNGSRVLSVTVGLKGGSSLRVLSGENGINTTCSPFDDTG
jgi:hypothetical protein